MLEISFGWKEESEAVVNAVRKVLQMGFRTVDIASIDTPKEKILDTRKMGDCVVTQLAKQGVVLTN